MLGAYKKTHGGQWPGRLLGNPALVGFDGVMMCEGRPRRQQPCRLIEVHSGVAWDKAWGGADQTRRRWEPSRRALVLNTTRSRAGWGWCLRERSQSE